MSVSLLLQNISGAAFAAASDVSIANQPGRIIGPIANLLGMLCNFLFNMVSGVFESGALGVTIILFTIIVRIILLPFAWYSSRSMAKMRVIQPEMKKIQDKYKGKADMDSKQKMQVEISELQRKNGANPMNGCLPLLIQMPIIFALFAVLNRVYVYIEGIGNIYTQLADILVNVDGIGAKMESIITGMPTLKKFVEKGFDLAFDDNFREVLSKMAQKDWLALLQQLPAQTVNALTPILERKENIEYFLGINLVERPAALSFSIIVPLLSGATTFLQTWLMNKEQGTPADEQAAMTQRYMLIAMPLMLGFMAFTLPAGLGLYWTVGNIFQIGQQYAFGRILNPKKEKKDS